MNARRAGVIRALPTMLLALALACGTDTGEDSSAYCDIDGHPPWLVESSVLVHGVGVGTGATDCRDGICRHNENTDLIRWKGAIYLVHRTALSQVLGPNSSLHIYRSDNEGSTFSEI